MSYASVDGLEITLDDAVLALTLDRPEKRNAVNDTIMVAMADGIDTAGRGEAVRVIVLAGNGDHFCGGADIVARNAPGGERPRAGSIQRRVRSTAHRLLPLVVQTQTPIVCRVQGWAAGIGVQLGAAAAVNLAAGHAPFCPTADPLRRSGRRRWPPSRRYSSWCSSPAH